MDVGLSVIYFTERVFPHHLLHPRKSVLRVSLRKRWGQFTGERDINMTMVYEHDLLRVPETLSNAELLCVVIFKFGRYVGISVSSNTTWDLEYLLHLNAVVVGNIHDNPDKAPNFTIE